MTELGPGTSGFTIAAHPANEPASVPITDVRKTRPKGTRRRKVHARIGPRTAPITPPNAPAVAVRRRMLDHSTQARAFLAARTVTGAIVATPQSAPSAAPASISPAVTARIRRGAAIRSSTLVGENVQRAAHYTTLGDEVGHPNWPTASRAASPHARQSLPSVARARAPTGASESGWLRTRTTPFHRTSRRPGALSPACQPQ